MTTVKVNATRSLWAVNKSLYKTDNGYLLTAKWGCLQTVYKAYIALLINPPFVADYGCTLQPSN